MNKKLKITIIAITIILMIVFARILFREHLNSVEDFRNYIEQYGICGPLVLIGIQAFQVVVPVFPGQAGYLAGTLAFGVLPAILYNYIGICLGSVIAYFLARKFGISIVLMMFSEKTYNKWSKKMEESKSYERFLFVATLLPLFPDDFLCYFSGLIKMNWKKFFWIIILGKPWVIILYCLGFGLIK